MKEYLLFVMKTQNLGTDQFGMIMGDIKDNLPILICILLVISMENTLHLTM